jgi:hypothetical protein
VSAISTKGLQRWLNYLTLEIQLINTVPSPPSALFLSSVVIRLRPSMCYANGFRRKPVITDISALRVGHSHNPFGAGLVLYRDFRCLEYYN